MDSATILVKASIGAGAEVSKDSSALIRGSSKIVAIAKNTIPDSGVLVGRSTISAIGSVIITSTGGATVGGSGKEESPRYNFRSDGLPPIEIEGTSGVKLAIDIGSAQGGVTIGGQARTGLIFYTHSDGGITIGGDQKSSGVSLDLTKTYEFAWRTSQAATVSYEFVWSTGQQRSYFYRVVGKTKTDVCDPLQADECCKTFVINIQAKTLEDVCVKLRERMGVWPVDKIQRFTRPAERSAIEEDAANGINYDCNVAEDVPFCNVPICAIFCIEYDLLETWGGYTILETTEVSAMGVQSLSISRKHRYEAQGGLNVGGQCKSRITRNLYFAQTAKVGRIGGAARHRSTDYRYESQGGVSLLGSAGRKTQRWKFRAGQWPVMSEPLDGTHAHGWDKADDGSFSCLLGTEPSPMLVLKGFEHAVPENGRLSGVIVEIDRFANGLIQDADIILFRGSDQSRNLSKDYNWPIALPVAVNYGSATDDWGVAAKGEFAVGIRVRPVVGRPDLKAVIRTVRTTFAYDEGGGRLLLSGSSASKVSHHRYKSKGGLRVHGRSRTQMVKPEPLKPIPVPRTPVRALGFVPSTPSKGMLVRALSTSTSATTITSIGQDVVTDISPLALTVTKCNCSGMPLAIPFSHNLDSVNKLSQFVQRNGQTIPKFLTLQYNKTNESWQANLRYSGTSATASAPETWSILFELQCTDILGGVPIGQGVWRFGLRVIQKNMGTSQDYDSRVLAAFLPDPICSKGREFQVKLIFDTQMGVVTTAPLATIYEVVVHDNIGLFKSSTWQASPKLVIDMSQVGLPPFPSRTTLNLG